MDRTRDTTSAPDSGDPSPIVPPASAIPLAGSRAPLIQGVRRNWRSLLETGVLVGIIVRLFWILGRALTFSPVSFDEVCFLWTGWAINRGLVPYRDFLEFKPPIVFFCNAVALKVFGLERQQYRYFFSWLAAISIIALAISLVRRKVNKGVILALVFFILALWVNPTFHDSSFDDAESMGISFYLLGIASLLANARSHLFADFAGGILLSLSVLSKEPFALTVLPTWMAFVAMRLDAGRIEAWRSVVRTLAGVALVATTLLAYLLLTDSLSHYVAALLRYLPFAKKICVEYGVWTPGPFLFEWQIRWNNLYRNIVNWDSLGSATPLLLAPLVLSRGRQWIALGFATLAAMGGLYAVTLGGCFFSHYYQLAMPSLFFFMAIGALRVSSMLTRLPWRKRACIGLLFALFPAVPLWPRIKTEAGTRYPRHGPLEDSTLIEFVKKSSTSNDTIFTTGLPGIYLYADRRHAARENVFYDAFLTLYPGQTDEERVRPIYDELVKSRPKIIIVDPFNAEKRERTAAALWRPFIEKYRYVKVDDRLYVRPD